jgi:ERF superfamily protein
MSNDNKNTLTSVHKSMNLAQKLVEIRKEIQYAQKSAKGFNFNYATESQILGMIRPKMDELRVLLHTNIEAPTFFQAKEWGKDGKEKEVTKFWVSLVFSWIDADNSGDRISSTYFGIGTVTPRDCQEIGAVITYNTRYFLYKSLSVPTDKDDPDAFDNMISAQKRNGEETAQKLTSDQIAKIQEIADPNRVSKICGMYNTKSLEDVEERHFGFIYSSLVNGKKKEPALT